jgi:hypothetical protein
VKDIDIMSVKEIEINKMNKEMLENIKNINILNMTNCYMLLNKKKKLIEVLNQMNDEIDTKTLKNINTNDFGLKYAWIVVKLKEVNNLLENSIDNLKSNKKSIKISNILEENKKKSLQIVDSTFESLKNDNFFNTVENINEKKKSILSNCLGLIIINIRISL